LFTKSEMKMMRKRGGISQLYGPPESCHNVDVPGRTIRITLEKRGTH
jgi:hypothetical protein